MLGSGLALVALALGLSLFAAHVRRLRPWDRPRWTLGAAYGAGFGAAWKTLLLAGLLLILVASPLVAGAVVAALLVAGARAAWARSPGALAGAIERELARRASADPSRSDAERLAELIRERHPEWGGEVIERIVAEHPRPADAARIVIRMERTWRR